MAIGNGGRTTPGETRPVTPARIAGTAAVCAAASLGAAIFGMAVGSSGADLSGLWRSLAWRDAVDPTLQGIFWQLRWPRVLTAMGTGAALGLSGLVFQAVLRNPLAEPYILGTSGGAAVGAVGGILLGLSYFPGVGTAAFVGSALSLAVVVLLSSGRAGLRRDALLLSGVMVNAFCGALILFFVSTTQDARLHTMLFWLMGDLSRADMPAALRLGIVLALGAAVLFVMARPMNLLLMGRDTAEALGGPFDGHGCFSWESPRSWSARRFPPPGCSALWVWPCLTACGSFSVRTIGSWSPPAFSGVALT